uniref:Transcription factor VBP n=1 Tax=Callorhinchus milii TaxID=7868 RepID=V9L4H7_CALMI|eukprot:gi/632981750/ref/XP_007907762.1/ PREDICTED: thyrotroph embryonic factor [Callorhinchus milii]
MSPPPPALHCLMPPPPPPPPPQKLLESEEKDQDKDKSLDGDEAASSNTAASASLMPTIWDKTIPYDGETFHLEYMDLDEFLLENSIPSSPTQLNGLMSVDELEEEKESQSCPPSPTPSGVMYSVLDDEDSDDSDCGQDNLNPVSTEAVEVPVNFEPDPTDLVLSSVPGGELFNPRKHKFSEEELKPQPMIKKAKKVYVPNELKDEKYWTRRKKNNVAAKRSRDARRLKENQITVRAAFLEKENAALRLEVAELRKVVSRCKSVISKYEAKHGAL